MGKLFTPAEAVEEIKRIHGRELTIQRLSQMRRQGRIHATVHKDTLSLYSEADIKKADMSIQKAGRRPYKNKK